MATEAPSFMPRDLADWRNWLAENHRSEKGLWLIFGKKGTPFENLELSDAVDEALCFGWVDSVVNGLDEQRYKLYFAPRSPKSNWSRVNKEKIARLEAEGRMQPAGMAMVALAQQTGTWTALDEVEDLVVPADLQAELDKYPRANEYWEAFPRSAKRGILEWLLNAKRPETRAKRVEETARLANENKRANSWPR